MNCHEAQRHWNLYHDSEGDVELHLRLGDHLEACAACAEWYRRQSHFERQLAAKLRAPGPDGSVWRQIHRNIALSSTPLAEPRRTRWWLSVAAGLLVVAWVVWRGLPTSFVETADLAQISAQWHQRLEAGEETLQFRSESDLAVESYLRERVTFPVRCPPRKDAGFAVAGAGVFRMADQPAAYLAGRVDAEAVSIFILPRDGLARFPRQQAELNAARTVADRDGPYQIAMGVIDQNAVLVVGKAKSKQLERVLSAYGTYPD
jgi:hypothetical protein